jgi:hypothetical protein
VAVTQYEVYRSATANFLQAAANKIGQSASTSYTDTTASGTVYYKVTARDASGNIGAPSTEVSATVDTSAPVVSMTAPANNATVSGPVVVSATASDNVAVSGVQFLLDGNNLGSEDTTSPYSLTWDSTTVANGAHSLSARARDGAGNVRTATAVSVTVNNSVKAFNGGTSASTVTLACAGNTTKVQSVAANQLLTISTGWTVGCSTVTFGSSNGWDTNLDDLMFN